MDAVIRRTVAAATAEQIVKAAPRRPLRELVASMHTWITNWKDTPKPFA